MGAGSAETERAGFEPAMEISPHTRLAGECLQPLGHLSHGYGHECKRRGARLERAWHHGRRRSAAGPWRGGRAVECAGLENQSPCKRTAGSNPAPSAFLCPAVVPARTGTRPPNRILRGASLVRSILAGCAPACPPRAGGSRGEASCRPVGRCDSRLPAWVVAGVDDLKRPPSPRQSGGWRSAAGLGPRVHWPIQLPAVVLRDRRERCAHGAIPLEVHRPQRHHGGGQGYRRLAPESTPWRGSNYLDFRRAARIGCAA